MPALNEFAARSAAAVLAASLAVGLVPAAYAAKKPAATAAKVSKKTIAPAVEVEEAQAPCDKDSGFCPARPCGPQSVLCIDASDKTGDDDEKSYLDIIDPKNGELRKIIFEDSSTAGQPNESPKGEFYSFVMVKNEFNDGNIIRGCRSQTKGAFTIANIAIDYKGQKGSSAVSFVPLSTLFIHANSVDVAKGAHENGCTFKSASRQIGPYLLFATPEAGQQEYTLHLKTTAGFVPPHTYFAMFAKLATSAAAVWPGFITISQPAGALVNTVAADLDQLAADTAVTSNIEYSAVLTNEKRPEKKDAGLSLRLWSPRLGSEKEAGYLGISLKRSASIVIDANEQGESITPDDVLANSGLGAPHRCIPGTGSCEKEQPFAKTLNADFVLYGDFTKTTPGSGKNSEEAVTDSPAPGASTPPAHSGTGTQHVKNGPENWSALFETCEKIRTTAADLGLTPIDALIVRWAVLQRAGLIDFFRAYQHGSESDFDQAIKGAFRVGLKEPYKQCWDAASDDKRMRAIETVMGTKFSPAIPE